MTLIRRRGLPTFLPASRTRQLRGGSNYFRGSGHCRLSTLKRPDLRPSPYAYSVPTEINQLMLLNGGTVGLYQRNRTWQRKRRLRYGTAFAAIGMGPKPQFRGRSSPLSAPQHRQGG